MMLGESTKTKLGLFFTAWPIFFLASEFCLAKIGKWAFQPKWWHQQNKNPKSLFQQFSSGWKWMLELVDLNTKLNLDFLFYQFCKFCFFLHFYSDLILIKFFHFICISPLYCFEKLASWWLWSLRWTVRKRFDKSIWLCWIK